VLTTLPGSRMSGAINIKMANKILQCEIGWVADDICDNGRSPERQRSYILLYVFWSTVEVLRFPNVNHFDKCTPRQGESTRGRKKRLGPLTYKLKVWSIPKKPKIDPCLVGINVRQRGASSKLVKNVYHDSYMNSLRKICPAASDMVTFVSWATKFPTQFMILVCPKSVGVWASTRH
jgi:hypothetical protein